MIGKDDISISAYEEGYLSADAFLHSPVPLPENPYPPGPWRPFRSWRKGWEDYHTEMAREQEIIEEQITRKADGLKIARLLKMENVSHLEKELSTLHLQQEKESRS